jgi:PAS domain S-box-containing protein
MESSAGSHQPPTWQIPVRSSPEAVAPALAGSRPAQLQLPLAVLDALQAQVAILDERGTIIAANRAWTDRAPDLHGMPVGVGADYLAACESGARADPRRAGIVTSLRQLLDGELGSFAAEHPILVHGQDRWFSLRASRLNAPGPPSFVVEHEDTTPRVQAERVARARSRLLDQIGGAVIASDMTGTVEVWSEGAEKLFGWRADEVVGRSALDMIVPPEGRDTARANFEALATTGVRVAERELARKDGTTFFAQATTVVYSDDEGHPAGIVNVSVDVTERVNAERELRGARDYLRAVTDTMAEAMCTLDVDGRVRYMNTAAERTLGWTLDELRGRPLHDSVHARHPDGSQYPADDCWLVGALRSGEPVEVPDDIFVRRDGTTIPVAYTSSPFEAENGTRGLVVVFSDITERKAEQDRLQREIDLLSQVGDLRDALDEDRFVLYAQPIIDLVTGDVFSHELLIRMVERDGALRAPGVFLPAAEKCGLIRDIDRWVIQQAAQLAGDGHRVELNLSATSLGDPELFHEFSEAMAGSSAKPPDIVVELTETALMRDEEVAAAFIERISTLGCEFALDDFGTGFGGFGYLKRLPVDYLKIDIEFVRDLRTNSASRHLVQAVVSLAEAFGQRTIAEGVEDDETLALVSAMGVDFAQGYAIGRPRPLDESVLSPR